MKPGTRSSARFGEDRRPASASVAAVVAFLLQGALLSAQKLPDPIIINIKEDKKSEIGGLADVLIGSLGLAGILILASILAAGVFAGLLFWIRSRAD